MSEPGIKFKNLFFALFKAFCIFRNVQPSIHYDIMIVAWFQEQAYKAHLKDHRIMGSAITVITEDWNGGGGSWLYYYLFVDIFA